MSVHEYTNLMEKKLIYFIILPVALLFMLPGCKKNEDTKKDAATPPITLPYTVTFSDYQYHEGDRFFTADNMTFHCTDGMDYEIPWIYWFDCYDASRSWKVEHYASSLTDSGVYLSDRENTLIADLADIENIEKITVSISDFKAFEPIVSTEQMGRIYLCDDNGLVKDYTIPYDFKEGDITISVSGKKIKHLNISAIFGALVRKIKIE